MEQIKKTIQDCLQYEPAFCTAACPFHLDVRDFISKIQRGGFNPAYRTYLNAVGFPDIVSRLCDEPCKEVCIRKGKDGAISMKLLEKAVVNYADRKNPNNYNISSKGTKVAVIGAGMSGLACALRLASKKYEVTVYERSNRIGGHLWDLLSPEEFLKEIEQQFLFEKYSLLLDTDITDLDDLRADVIYVATGSEGRDFGLSCDPRGPFASTKPGVFLGGMLTGSNIVQSIADGLHVAGAMERYIKTGGINHPFEMNTTKLTINPSSITYSEPVIPKGKDTYSQEEAVLEAARCLKCSCDACIRNCEFLSYYKKFPKRIEEEVEITIHPGTLAGNGTVATRLIATCHQCGLCKEVCPEDIDTGDFLLASMRTMHKKDAMPWAFHDFWLRDMEFANSDEAQLVRPPKGYSQSNYMFFPGCQLGASDPQYVIQSYRWLLNKNPDTALMLGCCGISAEWAGDEKLRDDVMTKIHENWISLGKPIAIFACPTCKQTFQRYLPEIQSTFLYNQMFGWGIPSTTKGDENAVSVFDPCSSREEPELQKSVRDLVKGSGFEIKPLPMEGKLAQCCSWGGQVAIANPAYVQEVVSKRITQKDNPYVTYCINCRDIFASTKKPVYHILDIVFGLHDSHRYSPTFTERRNNRVKLKRQLLGEFWKDEVRMEKQKRKLEIDISAQLSQKLNDEMILEEEIEAVIEHCESTGKKVLDPQTGHFCGHLQIGKITYWAEYLPLDSNHFELITAYSHRMSIEEA